MEGLAMTQRGLVSAVLFVAFYISCTSTYAQVSNTNVVEQKKKEYLTLVEKLKKGSTDVNFGQLRRAFVEWKVAGGNPGPHPKRDEMVKAFQSNKNLEAVKVAEEVIESEFYNHNIFGAMTDAYRALGNKEKADYYNGFFHKAQHGLFLSGDGKSPETAYYVLSISEEYRVMNDLGYTVSFQSLMNINGQAFDVLSGKDSKGTRVEVYFNICFFFSCGAK